MELCVEGLSGRLYCEREESEIVEFWSTRTVIVGRLILHDAKMRVGYGIYVVNDVVGIPGGSLELNSGVR
jgi:hypothetical protein